MMTPHKKTYTYLIVFFLPIVLWASFLEFDPGPESLKNTGKYTYDERIYYHKDFDINDMLVRNNKYILTHLGEFINVAPIYRAGKIKTLEMDLNKDIGKIVIRTPHFGVLPLDEFIRQSSNQGFLVIHQGKIVYENYNKIQDYQYHAWMSITKTLLSWTLQTMKEDGLIDLSEPLGEYLPTYRNTAYGKVPIKDIMNMTSGIFGGDQVMGRILPYFRFQRLTFSPRLSTSFRALPSAHPPGTQFVYSSSDSMMLTMLIEHVLDRPLAHFLTERLWSKLGMEHDAAMGMFGINMGSGMPVSGGLGLMLSTLRDLGRYALIYTPSWSKVSDKRLVSQEYLDDFRNVVNRPGLERFFTLINGEEDFFEGNVGFGMGDMPLYGANQWDMIFGDGDMLKLGVNSQGLYVSPEKDLVIAYFGYSDHPPEFTHAYARAIARYYEDGRINRDDPASQIDS